MLRYTVVLVALLFYCSSAQAACNDANSQKLWKYITAPALRTFRAATDNRRAAEKQLRGTVRTELNMLHSFAGLGSNPITDMTIRAYYISQGREEVGEWIVAQGGAAFLSSTIPCFKRNYRHMLFDKQPKCCCGKGVE